MDAFVTYIKDHVALTVVLAVVLVAIVVLIVLLAVDLSRAKRKRAEAQNVPAAAPQEETEEHAPREEEEKAPQPAEETEEPAPREEEEKAPQPAEETPSEEEPPVENDAPAEEPAPVKETPEKEPAPVKEAPAKEEEMKQEKKPVKPVKPAAAAKPAKPAPVVAAKPAKPAKKENAGKWILYEEDRGGYGFRLVASNGEVMIKSSSPYASLASAKSGVKTYQDNIAAGRLEVVETKKGNFFVQLNNASKRLLATSADYKTRTSCESAMESIKRWAATTVVVVENSDEDDKK